MTDVDEQAAERGRDAGVRRHQHRGDRELLGERRSVQRPGSPEDDEGELAGVVAAADRDQSHGVGHVGVRHLQDRVRGVVELEPEGLADTGQDGLLGRGPVEPHRAADQLLAQPSEHDVRVGVRRLRVAAPVARRAGIGARRLRPVAERPGRVDPGERPAARADGEHLDRREADRVAVLDEPLLRHARLPVVDERDVGARPAHVEPDRVRVAAEAGEMPARDGAGRDARGGKPHREALRRMRRHHAAAGVQQQQVAVVPALREPAPEPLHIAPDEGREHGVRDRGREALVLEDLRQDLGGGRHCDVGQLLLQDLAHPQLVGRVRVGVDEADRHGRDAAPAENAGDPPRLLLVQRRHDLAGEVDALLDLEAVAASDVGRSDVLVGVPEVVLRAATDLDHVAKALRRHHRRRRQPPREQRVRRHGRAVAEEDEIAELDSGLLHAGQHPVDRDPRSRGPSRPRPFRWPRP